MPLALSNLQAFLGWCTIINLCLLTLSFLSLLMMRTSIVKLHHKMLGVPEQHLAGYYFNLLGIYKLLIVVFNIVPYFVLRFIG